MRILRRADLADQETYLKIWTSAGQLNPAVATPITWMVAIARNRAIDLVREKPEMSLEEESDAIDVVAEAPDPLTGRQFTEELKRLLASMGKLDPECQRLVLLAYYSGCTREQLAARCDKPVNTIEIWLGQSLAEIRGCLGHEVCRYTRRLTCGGIYAGDTQRQ